VYNYIVKMGKNVEMVEDILLTTHMTIVS